MPLLGCSSSLSDQESEDAGDQINGIFTSEDGFLIGKAEEILTQQTLSVSFSPAGPTTFEVDDSTLDDLAQEIVDEVGVFDATELTDQLHRAVEGALEDTWSSMVFTGSREISDNFLCPYSAEYEITLDTLDAISVTIDSVIYDVDPSTQDISLDLSLSSLRVSSHASGLIDITNEGLCPDLLAVINDDFSISTSSAQVSLRVELESQTGSCYDTCCDDELEAVIHVEQASLSGLTKDLPYVTVSALGTYDLDTFLEDSDFEKELNSVLSTSVIGELVREPLAIGSAVADSVSFHTSPDGLEFNWAVDWDGDDLRACDVCPDDAANDVDGDRYCPSEDNCVNTYNPGQSDNDGDRIGDECDDDDDNDGIDDSTDNCQYTANKNQDDQDSDGVGDVCDNCVWDANPTQADYDSDGEGNECDDDDDGDGVNDDDDNCPIQYNPSQDDSDNDGYGDACDDESLVDTEYLDLIMNVRLQAIIALLHDAGYTDGPWGSWSELAAALKSDEQSADFDAESELEAAHSDAKSYLSAADWPKSIASKDIMYMMSADERVADEDAYQHLDETLGM